VEKLEAADRRVNSLDGEPRDRRIDRRMWGLIISRRDFLYFSLRHLFSNAFLFDLSASAPRGLRKRNPRRVEILFSTPISTPRTRILAISHFTGRRPSFFDTADGEYFGSNLAFRVVKHVSRLISRHIITLPGLWGFRRFLYLYTACNRSSVVLLSRREERHGYALY